MANPVPATALSGFASIGVPSTLVIGDTEVPDPIPSGSRGFMFVVVDLSTLQVVAKAAPVSNSTVPPEVQPYAGKEGYFLFFMAVNQISGNLPQGDLYTFLMSTGAGPALENLEQVVTQIGTSSLVNYAYVLAGTLDSGDLPGFEASSLQGYAVLPMQFIPITVNGNTTYAPSRYTNP